LQMGFFMVKRVVKTTTSQNYKAVIFPSSLEDSFILVTYPKSNRTVANCQS